MKKLAIALWAITLFGLLVVRATAQVNVVPQVGLTTSYLGKATYSAAFFGLVPVSAGTDIVCIAGSATKEVAIRQIKISGTTATAVQSLPIQLLRRVSVDTGGTAASTTANPANTVSKRKTSDGAATATLISYTANPTITDASPTYIDSQELTMPIVTSVESVIPVNFDYRMDNVGLLKPPILNGAAAQICINIAGATITNASVWNGVITWTEE